MSKYISPWHLSAVYTVSPVGHSWSGWHGADTSSVFISGNHTLKRREVQFHGIPTDAAAILTGDLIIPLSLRKTDRHWPLL